uniref:N-acetyl-alpha-D-glucosaminyl L-malate synthase BshA n=1 Tax=uncultured Allobacillus sp. TaxID=1638025 RepID=UPI002595DF94|nr:N-acetyl-alpha-D-glucosaminyl L-malate synthase BshA [uncultured Allobacillus sp.]
MNKKIGIVCYPTVGGSGVVATELGMHLSDRDYEIHFISQTMPFRLKRLDPNIFFHEVDIANYPVFKHPPYDLSLASKIAEVIDREQLDIIHAHYAMPHAICALLAKQMAKKEVRVITTLHGTDITVLGIDPSLTNLIRFGIEESDAVTAVSYSLRDQTKELLNIQKEIEVVHNFIESDKIDEPTDKEELKRKLTIQPDEKVMIHISNFRKVKRVQDVIHVFHRVQQTVNTKLLLVGDGPEYGDAYQLVQRLGLQEKVTFMGRQDNIHDLFAISDLNLLVSEKESFGLVLLEAMIAGVPSIGTNTGGIPEVIKDGDTGYICEVGDIEAMSKRAIHLLSDESEWKRQSTLSKERVRECFDAEQIIKRYENLYYEV